MLANVILGIFSTFLLVALVRSLITGRIAFGTGPSGLLATRETQPLSFWLIFGIGAGTLSLFIWLLVAA